MKKGYFDLMNMTHTAYRTKSLTPSYLSLFRHEVILRYGPLLQTMRTVIGSRRVALWTRYGAYSGAIWGAFFGTLGMFVPNSSSYSPDFAYLGTLSSSAEGAFWVALVSGSVACVSRYQALRRSTVRVAHLRYR